MDIGDLMRMIELYPGHFTLLKFSTNWRAAFNFTPMNYEDIQQMPVGETAKEAICEAIKRELAKK